MFTLVRKNVYRWETPFPRNNSNLVGHLILNESNCILIDPPCVPDLVESLNRLHKPVSIVLTSQNHTRGTGYLAAKTGGKVYVPDQNPKAVEEEEQIALKGIGKFEKYKEGELLGMKVFKDFYDFALLTDQKELIVSDNGRGTFDGKLQLWPEFSDEGDNSPNTTIHSEFKKLVGESGAVSLLAGHGYDILGNLQKLAEKL